MAETRTPKADEEKVVKEFIQQRFKRMFSGKNQPLSNMSLQEVEALQARVAELEAELAGHPNTGTTDIETRSQSSDAGQIDPPKPGSSKEQMPGPRTFRSALAGLGAALATMAREFGQSKIQTRLTALILLITIPLLLGIGASISAQARSRLEANALRDLQQNNETLAMSVDTWLELNTQSIKEMVLLPSITSMDAEQQQPVLQAMAQAHPYMYLVSTTDLAGMNVARNDSGEPTDYSDRAWFQNAQAGSSVTYESLIGKTSGRPALVVSMPIADNAGNIVGVGMFAADLTNLSQETRVRTFGQTGYTYIVDADNHVLAHPDPAFTQNELRDLSEYPAVAAMHQGQTGHLTFTDEHGAEWLAYIEVLDSGWAVITQQQSAEILAPVGQFQRVVFAMILIGALVMLILTWFTIRGTLQPIHVLTNTVSAIAAGDLNRVAEVKTRDEIGTLASAFNHMTSQLRDLIGSLEQRILDRTHDLDLAAEVGRTASEKVMNLSEMLTEAAEMIRSRFNLYYTQIYLTDPSGERITLYAGTGEAGKELLQRRHYLLINSSSLNGRAVVEKQAQIVADTHTNPNFLPNMLLPQTRSEMAIPLIVSGRVVGVLDMQSEQPGALSESNLPAFEALAGQLAIAIQNAELFAEARESRAEVEAQVRRFTEQGWQNFLDAIHQGQKIGFTFDESRVIRLGPEELSRQADTDGIQLPIRVTGTQIGEIHLPVEEGRHWTNTELDLINATSAQLAQHIENLRLLAQAEQFRIQAEEAVHHLTREGWEGYKLSHADEAPGYLFNLVNVEPLPADSYGQIPGAFKQPLVVRGETIGELAVGSLDQPAETAEIITAVAEQLGGHIENLRLLEQTEKQRGQLTDALRASQLAYWEYDFVNNVFTFNDQFYALHRTTAEREGGYTMPAAQYASRFVYPEDMPIVGAEIQKAVETTDPNYSVQLDHRIIYADGEVGYFNVRFQIEKDAEGRTVRSYGANQDITERKKAEEILRVSEARRSEALKIAKLANWEYDFERDRFIFNDHFYSIFHTTVEKVGGYELSSAQYAQFFVHPEDAALVGNEIGKAIASTDRQYNAKLEHRILFADGGIGYIAVDVNIERDENGNITRWYGANQDITERKRAEEAIIAEQQRTQTILESVTVPMVITRLSDNHLTFVNAPALEVTQFDYEQVINQPSPNFYADLDDRKKFITELRAKGEVADMVVQLLRANGEVFWALMSAKIFDYQAEPAILTTFMDITDRIHAQETVAKRATELATVAQVSTTASTVLDPDELLQAVVDLTKERFGLYHVHIYLADESWNTLLLAAGADEVGRKMVADGWNIPMDHEQSIVASAARNRESVIANDVIRDASSSYLSNQLLPDTRSEMAVPMIVGQQLLGVFDVQADKADHFSEEDANIYTTLAAQVAVALQNARLYREQAATLTQLRELDKLKSSFLANMSHELRTPLNSILGFTDVMLEGLDGALTQYMDNDLRLIQKNGQHLLHLINDVLDMAKIEAGRMNLNLERFTAFEVLDEVTSITSTLASEKKLSLSTETDSDRDVQIYADRTRLRQVMINLVNNAIKFTETGTVSLKVASLPGARVLITVKDTGIGIAPEKLDAIFQEFTQVDSSSTRKVGGTGLGLPISRRLVEMHGGRLWAESTGHAGEGSTFFVELPIEARVTETVEKQVA